MTLRKILICLLLFGCSVGSNNSSSEQRPPNFVIILADDLGYGDLGAYRSLYQGGDNQTSAFRHTPNIDQLAEQGVRFTRAYANSWCAPSRQMLLSGLWANRTNAYSQPWVGNQLRQEGYATGMFGKSHGQGPTQRVYGKTTESNAEFDDGLFFNGGMRTYYMESEEMLPGRWGLDSFEFRAEGDEYLTDVFTDYAVNFIERHGEEDPFMLYLPYTAPHSPLEGKPEDLRNLFPSTFGDMTDEQIKNTANSNNQQMRNYHYTAMVHNMDAGIGRIMQALREQGVAENTIIIFTSDNGAINGSNYPLTGHKWDDLEGGIRVPFVIWSADIAKGGQSGSIHDGLVSLADVAPTVVETATGQSYSYETDGMNLMPFLKGDKLLPGNRLFYWANTSLPYQLTDIASFDGKKPEEGMNQAVLVLDSSKVLRWNKVGSDKTGASFHILPNAEGEASPQQFLMEQVPTAGEYPQSETGKELKKKVDDLLLSDDNGLGPNWYSKPGHSYE